MCSIPLPSVNSTIVCSTKDAVCHRAPERGWVAIAVCNGVRAGPVAGAGGSGPLAGDACQARSKLFEDGTRVCTRDAPHATEALRFESHTEQRSALAEFAAGRLWSGGKSEGDGCSPRTCASIPVLRPSLPCRASSRSTLHHPSSSR